MSEITRYKLHCGWMYECASYFKPSAIQDDVPMVLASDHDKRVAELEAELAEAVELIKQAKPLVDLLFYGGSMDRQSGERVKELFHMFGRHGDKS